MRAQAHSARPGRSGTMKDRPRKPAVPSGRTETVRQHIRDVLKGNSLSAKEISQAVGASEKEVYDHLGHIQMSLGRQSFTLVVMPAECRKCGFSFTKRERLKKPGRCPLCRSESIEEPRFSIQ